MVHKSFYRFNVKYFYSFCDTYEYNINYNGPAIVNPTNLIKTYIIYYFLGERCFNASDVYRLYQKYGT